MKILLVARCGRWTNGNDEDGRAYKRELAFASEARVTDAVTSANLPDIETSVQISVDGLPGTLATVLAGETHNVELWVS